MSPQQPLRGKRFLVTRPEGQADRLLDGIRAMGGEAHHIPLLAIHPVEEQAALKTMVSQLTHYRACIFISANAVNLAWPTVMAAYPGGWPHELVAAAIGPGTVRVLKSLGVAKIVAPAMHFDSEGLLAEAFFAEAVCRGERFALIRGEGGRDFLAQGLCQRGAQVDEATIYRRTLHPASLQQLEAWLNAAFQPRMLLISSSESLQRIMSEAPAELGMALRASAVLVPHPRIGEAARQLGFARVAVCDGGDEGMLRYLKTYNETHIV